jgi:hypothetical protein
VRKVRPKKIEKAMKPKKTKNSKLFPPNIENATRDEVKSLLESWDDKIVAKRAARLGISVEEALRIEPKPLFIIEVEQRAVAEARLIVKKALSASSHTAESTDVAGRAPKAI